MPADRVAQTVQRYVPSAVKNARTVRTESFAQAVVFARNVPVMVASARIARFAVIALNTSVNAAAVAHSVRKFAKSVTAIAVSAPTVIFVWTADSVKNA